ncbi:MAG: NUDIX domain-containing protein [Patescibacteria group bacterium]
MAHNVNIHDAQTLILRELLFQPDARFVELQKQTGLSSDHFSFHLNKLLELAYVVKISRGRYSLSPAGKEHANKLDTDDNTIERQPKVAVLLGVTKYQDGETLYLMQERLKQPYYGFWGFPTGKIRWGETILEAASRELDEETGLEATCKYIGLYHEHVTLKESGEMIEDKIFHFVLCKNPIGDLLESFEGGRNKWMTLDEVHEISPKFESFEHELSLLEPGAPKFLERTVSYSQAEF